METIHSMFHLKNRKTTGMKKTILISILLAGHFTFCLGQKSAAPPLVTNLKDSLIGLSVPTVSLEVNALKGGRISSLKLGGTEFLSLNKLQDNWGATFWTSPQSDWGWPPSAAINSRPYKAEKKGNEIVLIGTADSLSKLSIIKKIVANPKDTSFSITYTIKNGGNALKKVAPWEITRVMPGGLTIFPTGKGLKKGDLTPLLKDSLGITWFQYEADKIPAGVPKLFSDGKEGWLAQVYNNMVLIQTFPDIDPTQAAPGEAEVELYAEPKKHAYIEIEQQGPYVPIEKGGTSSWTVKWYLRGLPSGMQASIGSVQLINYIKRTIH
jgi:hypothetical protein